jgi:thiol-disulfide isomerase/thioredoxin
MNKLEQRFIIIAVALAAVVAGALLSRSRVTPPPTAPEAASQLLALSLADTAGVRQNLAQWRGKVLVVNFWATWCPPCREEMPGFSRLSRKYATKGVQFVGIGIDTAEKIRKFAAESDIPYPLLIGEQTTMQLAVEFGNRSEGLPFTVILDRTGATHKLHLGRLDEPALESILAKML